MTQLTAEQWLRMPKEMREAWLRDLRLYGQAVMLTKLVDGEAIGEHVSIDKIQFTK